MQLDPPLVGWFHLSDEETSRARDFLRRCNAEDAVDELGFGILRDGFSDQFYPGTSTVMTQPRYLLFIPAIYRSMERMLAKRKDAYDDIYRQSRKMQDQLRDMLAESYGHKRGSGVIGISVKEPERYPSSIYWASLRTLGIFRRRGMVESDYLQVLRHHYEASRSDPNNGDPVAEIAAVPPAWDSRLPDATRDGRVQDERGQFVEGLRFELLPEEAIYLANCYLHPDVMDPTASRVDQSLMAYLIERKRKTGFTFPWDVAAPAHLKQAIEDAQHFSIFARGATLHYYFLLIQARQQQGWTVPEADVEAWFGTWWDDGRSELLDWSEGDFLERRRPDVRPVRKDELFFHDWLGLCRNAKNAKAFLRDNRTRELIIERERICKPRKARLVHPKYLESWNRKLPGSNPIYQLDFRTSIGATFVKRIVEGLCSVDEHEARAR